MNALVNISSIPTGLINRLLNGDYALNYGTLTRTDGQEAYPGWRVLTQTGSVSCSVVSNPEAGQVQCARITQSQSAAQRVGLIQVINNADSGDLRQAIVNLAGRLRLSAAANVRFAVLDWTGTADTMPADVVSNWDATSYTSGQFFLSTVSVVAVGIFRAETAGTWGSVPYVPMQVLATSNNVAVFVWTQDALAQNGTLDIGVQQLSLGNAQPIYEHRPLRLQQLLAGSASSSLQVLADIDTLQAQLWTTTEAPTEVLLIQNHYSGDQTGFELFRFDPSDTTTADDNALTIVTASGRRYKRDWDKRNAKGQWWGIIANGSTQCGALINTAMAALYALGGGRLMLPSGVIIIEVPVDNIYDRVIVDGAGFVSWSDAGLTWTYGTQLYANFAGTAVKLRSPYGATNSKKKGGGFVGLMINGGLIATGGIEVDSVSQVLCNVYVTGVVGAGNAAAKVKAGITGTNLAEACDVQNSQMTFYCRSIDDTNELGVHSLVLDGSSNANPSFNQGQNGYIAVVCQHKNGNALWGKSADNNDISVRATRAAGGTGKTVLASGPTASLPVGFELNSIVNASGVGDIYAEGTGDPGVLAGIWNKIAPDYGNGTPTPTSGTGSYWAIDGGQGDLENYSMVHGVSAQTNAQAIAARPNVGTASHYIYNINENNLVIANADGAWKIRVMSGGNMDIARLSGTGKLNLPAVASLLIDSAQVSLGAADSGGAGFKLLRIPN